MQLFKFLGHDSPSLEIVNAPSPFLLLLTKSARKNIKLFEDIHPYIAEETHSFLIGIHDFVSSIQARNPRGLGISHALLHQTFANIIVKLEVVFGSVPPDEDSHCFSRWQESWSALRQGVLPITFPAETITSTKANDLYHLADTFSECYADLLGRVNKRLEAAESDTIPHKLDDTYIPPHPAEKEVIFVPGYEGEDCMISWTSKAHIAWRLAGPNHSPADRDFFDAFLLCRHRSISAVDFFQCLCHFYGQAHRDAENYADQVTWNEQVRDIIRQRVFHVVLCWLKHYWHSSDAPAAHLLRDFLQKGSNDRFSDNPLMLKAHLDLLEECLALGQSPTAPSGSIPGRGVHHFVPVVRPDVADAFEKQLSPEQLESLKGFHIAQYSEPELRIVLAQQLTLIYATLFRELNPLELLKHSIDHNWSCQGQCNARSHSEKWSGFQQCLKLWVLSTIFGHEHPEDCLDSISWTIGFAKDMRDMRNFDAFITIADALRDPTVQAFKRYISGEVLQEWTVIECQCRTYDDTFANLVPMLRERDNIPPPTVPPLQRYTQLMRTSMRRPPVKPDDAKVDGYCIGHWFGAAMNMRIIERWMHVDFDFTDDPVIQTSIRRYLRDFQTEMYDIERAVIRLYGAKLKPERESKPNIPAGTNLWGSSATASAPVRQLNAKPLRSTWETGQTCSGPFKEISDEQIKDIIDRERHA
ncbi:ras guanine nucleotide exchange factor domain-containing protein [Vararia minispora EC-137]|uniref:Ras guanine nucleotide exchange factor domain-containing protein n=1 Tax=Vararia minispora EC-137 TaxID=1314806 RepID=A0ACB8QM26_9AGAM|nr:ras guanine nucleotide exchange factor domain-containing protein [Vararia minispora EC-137]